MLNIAVIIIFIISISFNVFMLTNKDSYERVLDINRSIELLNSEDPRNIIIDLRDEEDYNKSHIKNSINIKYTKDGTELLKLCGKFENKSRKLILICYGGNRSANAFETLITNNYQNIIDISLGYNKLSKEYAKKLYFETGKAD